MSDQWRCTRCGVRCLTIPRYDDLICTLCAKELIVGLPDLEGITLDDHTANGPLGYTVSYGIERAGVRMGRINVKRRQ